MHQVVIDGTPYLPADAAPSIGIGVTTRNRPDALATTLKHLRTYLPPAAKLVVVDDASDKPVEADYRFDENVGIAAAKNKCLELLDGCTHVFLWDDDAYPIADDWWRPYIESPEPHLMYIFKDLAGPRKLNDIAVIGGDDRHTAYTGPRGVMLYLHRSAIDAVGGMDPIYGKWGYEHGDLSNRIHHAGLTTWRYADVHSSADLIYSLDEHEAVNRVVAPADRKAAVAHNAKIHNHRVETGYTAYVEYREPRDVVITNLLTSQPDPQRQRKWPADPKTLSSWAKSIAVNAPTVSALVLADELTAAPHGSEVVRVPDVPMNVYFRRWQHIYAHLRDHPEYRWVWCTDGSDVQMLHNPFPHMKQGHLYLGSEPVILADEWMRKNHPANRIQTFLDDHPHATMLNAGLVGGDRETVMALAHDMVREYHDLAAARFWKKEPPETEIGDMATLNLVAYSRYADKIITGPVVHTVFRSNTPNKFSWWKHK